MKKTITLLLGTLLILSSVVLPTFSAAAKESPLPGDVNLDGKVTISDAALMVRSIAVNDLEINEEAADVNGDGLFYINDVALLLRYFAGWDVTLGDNGKRLPKITEFSTTEITPSVYFPLPEIEGAVLTVNGEETVIDANDPLLIRLINFFTYSEEYNWSARMLGIYDRKSLESIEASKVRLEIKFLPDAEDADKYMHDGKKFCLAERMIVTDDQWVLICDSVDVSEAYDGEDYSVLNFAHWPYSGVDPYKSPFSSILEYAGFLN